MLAPKKLALLTATGSSTAHFDPSLLHRGNVEALLQGSVLSQSMVASRRALVTGLGTPSLAPSPGGVAVAASAKAGAELRAASMSTHASGTVVSIGAVPAENRGSTKLYSLAPIPATIGDLRKAAGTQRRFHFSHGE
jgi:hypothetical protein